MLEQILDYIHNYFIVDKIEGQFNIDNGSLDVTSLQEGQYFRISGSIFNDGVHQYPTADLTNESFKGKIEAMAVPPALISLSTEVKDWVDKYGSVMNSPYASESFGGYSYTKAQGSASTGAGSSTWQSVFGSRLNKWRKIS